MFSSEMSQNTWFDKLFRWRLSKLPNPACTCTLQVRQKLNYEKKNWFVQLFHFSGLCNVLFEWLFFNSWKRRRIRDRARYFVGNSKLKFPLIKPIKIATNRYTTPHMYQKILAEIIHAALIGYIKVPKTELSKFQTFLCGCILNWPLPK